MVGKGLEVTPSSEGNSGRQEGVASRPDEHFRLFKKKNPLPDNSEDFGRKGFNG